MKTTLQVTFLQKRDPYHLDHGEYMAVWYQAQGTKHKPVLDQDNEVNPGVKAKVAAFFAPFCEDIVRFSCYPSGVAAGNITGIVVAKKISLPKGQHLRLPAHIDTVHEVEARLQAAFFIQHNLEALDCDPMALKEVDSIIEGYRADLADYHPIDQQRSST
jgi:hypothetical protein